MKSRLSLSFFALLLPPLASIGEEVVLSPQRLEELRQNCQSAASEARDAAVEQYFRALKQLLEALDARERDRSQAAKHLLEYASLRDAVIALDRALLSEPQKAIYLQFLSQTDDRVKRWSDPDSYYRQKMEEARALWAERLFPGAATVLHDAAQVAIGRKKVDATFLEAIAHLSLSQTDRGKKVLDTLCEEWPGDRRARTAHYLLGHIEWCRLNYEKASVHFQKAQDGNPSVLTKKSASYKEALLWVLSLQ